MSRKRPTFIGIGAQKCATSWIYQVLNEHPDICLSSPKELDFFSYYFNRGYDWYERHFSACTSARAMGEISPSYFCSITAPNRVINYNPDARIILSLRSPVERAFSNHLHEVRAGHHPFGDTNFDTGLENNPMYIEQSMYCRHIQRWLDVFPREQVMVLFQETIAVKPDQEARKLYRFVGADDEYQPAWTGRRANESALPRSEGLAAVIRRCALIFRSAGLGSFVSRVKTGKLGAYLHGLNSKSIRDDVTPMSNETRARLEDMFSAENVCLKELLKLDVLPWE